MGLLADPRDSPLLANELGHNIDQSLDGVRRRDFLTMPGQQQGNAHLLIAVVSIRTMHAVEEGPVQGSSSRIIWIQIGPALHQSSLDAHVQVR